MEPPLNLSLGGRFVDNILDLAFPTRCLICDERVGSNKFGYNCQKCWDAISLCSISDNACSKCGATQPVKQPENIKSCSNCASHFYDRARAVARYDGSIKTSILELKSVPKIHDHLKQLISARLAELDLSVYELVVPVPLSRRRQHDRGFNQAELIASVVAGETGLPIDSASLARELDTAAHRSGMDRKARERSVKNAFKVKRKNLIRDKSILLIDDVFTTGATASACAKELKAHGADSVGLFTIARV